MITAKYSFINDHEKVLRYLKAAKSSSLDRPLAWPFTVLDVGASDNPWTVEVLDATLDFKPTNVKVTKQFTGNINDTEDWKPLLDYVKDYGKFSFSVCSHTLEDLAYPKVALEMLPRVSRAGFISMPSHFQDMTKFEGDWPGYIHHRWMFVVENDKLVLVPKIPFVAKIEGVGNPPVEKTELQIFWEDTIPYEILNGDYLGPNVQYVKDMYAKILGGRY